MYSIDSGWNNIDINCNTTSNTQSTIQSTSVQLRNHTANNGCNESLKHSHEQKSLFHGMKSAFRMVSTGQKGVDNPQVNEALRIAGSIGRAYLQTKDIEYDADRSEEYLDENFLNESRDEDTVIEKAIEKAWNKIDSGGHKGGARIAVSVAHKYLDEYTLPQTSTKDDK